MTKPRLLISFIFDSKEKLLSLDLALLRPSSDLFCGENALRDV